MEVEHRFDLERIGNYGYYMEEELRNAGWYYGYYILYLTINIINSDQYIITSGFYMFILMKT